MKQFSLLVLLACAALASYAQQQKSRVKGKILLPEKTPLQGATVSLLRAADSSLVKVSVSNKEGWYEMEGISSGSYFISATAVGMADLLSAAVEIKTGETTIPDLTLIPAAAQLSGVTVVGKRPMIETRIDKMIVNVDATISNAGSSALEVLEKSPGVMVDRDGNISLKGKQGVMVMLDGKPTYLSAQDLANMLRNMPSSQLDQIEIMTQPSAKYDAAGNSGIINIKTKKNKQQGFNGNISTSFIQAFYPKSSTSVQGNYRTGKFNIFGNYSFNYWTGFTELNLNRKFRENGNITSVFDQESFVKFNGKGHSLRGGIDFFADKNTTIGLGFNGSFDPRRSSVASEILIKNGAGELQSRNEASTSGKENWYNGGVNLNIRRVLNEKGREITGDLDFITYDSRSTQYSSNTLYDAEGNVEVNPGTIVPNPYILQGTTPSIISIYSGRVDYAHPFKKTGKLEAGLKSSYVENDNNAPYEYLDNGVWKPDARSNHFIYRENINALYVNYSAQFKKLGLQTGLRMENTVADGHQLIKNEKFRRNYTEFFPTAYLSYALNEENQLGLSIGRRIERPNYKDLNPFQQILDQFTYQEGNPLLLPQFSKKVELSYNLKGTWNFVLNYTKTTDIINEILRQDDEKRTTFQTKDNIASSENAGIAISYNKQILKWWYTNVYANGNYNYYAGVVNNTALEADMYTFMINLNNQFKFGKGWGAEVSGFYRSQDLEGGIIVGKPMGVINFGASKQVLNNKGSIRLNIRDPFWIQRFRGYTQFDNLDITINNRWDNRRLGVTFTYRFGKGQQAPPRRKTGSASDEEKRVGNQGQQ